MFNKARPEWQPNAVLYAVDKDSLSYVRVPWDIEQTAEFAPWRLEPLTPQELVSDDGFKPANIQPADAELVAGALADTPESASRADEDSDTNADADTDAGTEALALADSATDAPADADAPPEPEMTTIAVDEVAAQQAAARQAGYDEGFAAGEMAGFEKGQAAGQASGEQRGREAAEATFKDAVRALNAAAGAVKTLNDDPRQYFDPLKRLALHLAEELVRGELTQSPAAIERLIQLSLDELEAPTKRITVQLHPADLVQIQTHNVALENGMVLQADPAMTRGSVQVSSNDAVVQDLIQKRLRTLANKVLLKPDDWAQSSPLLSEGPLWATTDTGTHADAVTEDATLVETPQAATQEEPATEVPAADAPMPEAPVTEESDSEAPIQGDDDEGEPHA
ncbi:MAG: FliH/SctL family protein [Burkholderiaceae bacterium]|nr:FliH/SctL family protein [Burkholderiaceae bacterium]